MYEDMTEDQKMIAEALEPIVTVIQQMLNKIEAMDEELDSLAKLVNEEIIGGITNLYNTKERLSKVSCLKEKFGPKMDQYSDFYKEMTDKDIYEGLYDEIEELKASAENLDDSAIDAKVDELSNILKAKMEKIKGFGVPAVAASVEVVENGPDKLVEKLRQMKAKSGDVKFN